MTSPISKKLVLDTTVLIALDWLGMLDLPSRLYEAAVIPRAVLDESQGRGANFPVIRPKENALARLDRLPFALDRGEYGVLHLCLEDSIYWACVDDFDARRAAKQLHIPHFGTMRLLIDAKNNAFISEVRPLIETLEAKGFYLKASIRDEVLRIANES